MITDSEFRTLIENSEVFQSYEAFKKKLFNNHKTRERLKEYYRQAERYGIDYLRGNQNLTASDFNLIKSIHERR